MRQGSGIRKLIWKSALGLALLPLFPSSCKRRPQAPAPPPTPTPAAAAPATPNPLEQAERYFESGDYLNAAVAYEGYLRERPDGKDRDRALYRLGLCLALPSNPSQNPDQAIAYLEELSTQYPKSSYKPEAELISALEREILDLHVIVTKRQQQVDDMSRQIDGLREQQGSLDQLRADLKDREDRIHQLSQELEKLKAIDLQRRPGATPAR